MADENDKIEPLDAIRAADASRRLRAIAENYKAANDLADVLDWAMRIDTKLSAKQKLLTSINEKIDGAQAKLDRETADSERQIADQQRNVTAAKEALEAEIQALRDKFSEEQFNVSEARTRRRAEMAEEERLHRETLQDLRAAILDAKSVNKPAEVDTSQKRKRGKAIEDAPAGIEEMLA